MERRKEDRAMAGDEVELARRILGATGCLRAAINLGNPVLAQRDAETGALGGISVRLARELARRLDLDAELTAFNAAGDVVAAADEGGWDVAFLAADPVRARGLAFSAPYVRIEGVFVVAKSSPWRDNSDLDQPGRRICVGRNAAYDLYLTRTLKHAELVRVDTSAAALGQYRALGLDAAAGIREAVEAFVSTEPDTRVMEPPFMQIQQAVALPRSHIAALAFVEAALEELKASGFI